MPNCKLSCKFVPALCLLVQVASVMATNEAVLAFKTTCILVCGFRAGTLLRAEDGPAEMSGRREVTSATAGRYLLSELRQINANLGACCGRWVWDPPSQTHLRECSSLGGDREGAC